MKLDAAEALVQTIHHQSSLFQPCIIPMIGRGGHAVQVTHRRHLRYQVVTNQPEWESVRQMWVEVLDHETVG